MKFTYTIPDKIIKALETQVVDIAEDLKREVEARIAILMQKAREAALMKTSGGIDVPALVAAAKLTPKRTQL